MLMNGPDVSGTTSHYNEPEILILQFINQDKEEFENNTGRFGNLGDLGNSFEAVKHLIKKNRGFSPVFVT
jgi:hypothetical protein